MTPTVLRSKVLNELHGQTLRVNGLRSMFTGWNFAVNPHLEQLRVDVNDMLDRQFPDHPKLQKLKAGDYALFGATWWPRASFERVRIATYLSIWLFIWDDEIDSDVGIYSDDFDRAQDFRDETLAYIRSRLGLDMVQRRVMTNNNVIRNFDEIGDPMRKWCTIDQREIFINEIGYFMEKSEIEQRLRLTERLPTLEEFSRYRLGTSAVRVVLALNEFCNETALPLEVLNDKDVASLWDLTNKNICIVNDLLSIKKELSQGAVESLIPILYVELGSAQGAVDRSLEEICASIGDFDFVARRALERFSGNAQLYKDIYRFIDGCRYYCTGNLSWSLSTGRYGVHQEKTPDALSIKL